MFSGLLPLGCNRCNPNTPDMKYDMQSIFLENWRITDQEWKHTPLQNNTEIVFNQFGIVIVAEKIALVGAINPPNMFSGFTFIPTAIACSPKDPRWEEEIADIQVISNNDFNASFPAGSTINNIIQVQPNNTQVSFSSIALSEFISKQPKANDQIILMLKQPPSVSSEQSFTVIYKLTNGEQYERTTLNVVIKP